MSKNEIYNHILENLQKAITQANEVAQEYKNDKPNIFKRLDSHEVRISRLENITGADKKGWL